MDLAVVGQDPAFGRGATAQSSAFLTAARELGRDPHLLYLRYFGHHGGVRPVVPGADAVNQLVAARRLAPIVRDARSAWAVSTVASHGYAAVRSGRPYACWIGTDLESEWAARRPWLPPSRRAALLASAPLLRRIERAVLARATAVYATSAFSSERLTAAGARDVRVLPIPVAPVEPLPDDEWQADVERPTLVFVGAADDPRKNVGLLLRAFAVVRERIPSARLRLVGATTSTTRQDGVERLGHVDDRDAILRRSTIFVLPSRQEGFGIVVAEALAAGVPVVATPSGGPEELLRRSGGGVVLDGFDVDELAATLTDLLGDPGRLAAMRAAGRAYVLREHSPNRFRQRLAAALDELDG